MRIIFMGTPLFAVPALELLIKNNHKIVAVYTQPPRPAGRGHKEQLSPVHILANQYNLQAKTPISLKSKEAQEEFASFKPDLAIVAAYGLILPKAILEIPVGGCINIHPSLLPRWRGAAPIQRTILAGDKETGVCIMRMDVGLDTGDILTCKKIEVPEKITSGMLHDSLSEIGAELLVETLKNIPPATQQSEIGVTYANKLTKEEALIGWQKSAKEIDCMIRGFNPWPYAYFNYNNEHIKIIEADYIVKDVEGACGLIIDDRLSIKCRDGIILPKIIQRPNKNKIDINEFLRGYQIPAGTILN